MHEVEKLKPILANDNISITKPRLAVFTTLQKADEPLKTGEIARRTPTVNRASVYRTLELFTQLGVSTTIIRGWTPYIELADPFKAHHHHIMCRTCGTTMSIESNALEDILRLVAHEKNHTLEQHTVELLGVCHNCQKATTKS